MLFFIIGIVMAVGKYFDVAGLGNISWWWCVIPFGLAILYWEIADEIFHKEDKKEMRIYEDRLKKQRRKLFEDGGMVKRDYKIIRAGDSDEAAKEKLRD